MGVKWRMKRGSLHPFMGYWGTFLLFILTERADEIPQKTRLTCSTGVKLASVSHEP